METKKGERSCMVLCVANFLKYMKYDAQANTLQRDSIRKLYMYQTSSRKLFIEMLKKIHFLKFQSNIDPNSFDIINHKSGMLLCSLVGKDQNNDHCVVLYEDLIFDSNEDFALKRTIGNLNYCCSSEKKYVEFVKCF